MVMRKYSFDIVLAAACSIAVAAVHAIAAVPDFVVRLAEFVWDLATDLARDGVRLDLGTAETWGGQRGEPLEPALLNSLRHEAGMRALPG